MDSIEEVQRYLDENHPGLIIMHWITGHYTIEQRIYRTELAETNDGSIAFGYREEGLQEVFRIKNRLLGSWLVDELQRRDPKKADIPGNAYHAAWKASLDAEAERTKDQKFYRSNAMESWELAKRNPALMERFAKRLSAGDTYAWQEFSLENIAKNAARYSGKEMRTKDFWRAL